MPDARAADIPVLEVRRTIRAPREAVFKAWTTKTTVQHWFDSPSAPVRKVVLEAKVGGRIAIDCDYKGGTWSLDGVVRELDAPRRFAFTWATTDCPAEVGSLVTLDFNDKGGATEIVLTHRGFPTPAKRNDTEGGWTEMMDHVETLMAAQPALRAEVRRTIEATPEAVWRAWTTPELMERFLAPGPTTGTRVTADVRVGGRFTIVMLGGKGEEYEHRGEFLEVDPPRRLKFSWLSDWSPPWVRPTVTIDLMAKGGATELVLVHEGQMDELSRTSHEGGWGEIVDLLVGLVKTGVIAASLAAASTEMRKAPRP